MKFYLIELFIGLNPWHARRFCNILSIIAQEVTTVLKGKLDGCI